MCDDDIVPDILVDNIEYLRNLELNDSVCRVDKLISCLRDKIEKRIVKNKIFRLWRAISFVCFY